SPSYPLFYITNPATPQISTLSLHDALPIFDTHEPSRQVADHRLRAAVARPDRRRDRRGRRRLGVGARRRAARARAAVGGLYRARSEEHTSELQSRGHLVCRLLLEKKNKLKS